MTEWLLDLDPDTLNLLMVGGFVLLMGVGLVWFLMTRGERDMKQSAEHDLDLEVGHDQRVHVGGSRTETIKKTLTSQVEGSRVASTNDNVEETVGGSHLLSVTGNSELRVSGRRTVRLEGRELYGALVGASERSLVAARALAVALGAALLVALPSTLAALAVLGASTSGAAAWERARVLVALWPFAFVTGALLGPLAVACDRLAQARGRSLFLAVVLLPFLVADPLGLGPLSHCRLSHCSAGGVGSTRAPSCRAAERTTRRSSPSAAPTNTTISTLAAAS